MTDLTSRYDDYEDWYLEFGPQRYDDGEDPVTGEDDHA